MSEKSEQKPMTWRELKDFVNTIPEEELDKKVVSWAEEDSNTYSSAECLTEDYFRGEGGAISESDWEDSIDKENGEEKVLCYSKGTPILHVLF
jgi:hypothetical protein